MFFWPRAPALPSSLGLGARDRTSPKPMAEVAGGRPTVAEVVGAKAPIIKLLHKSGRSGPRPLITRPFACVSILVLVVQTRIASIFTSAASSMRITTKSVAASTLLLSTSRVVPETPPIRVRVRVWSGLRRLPHLLWLHNAPSLRLLYLRNQSPRCQFRSQFLQSPFRQTTRPRPFLLCLLLFLRRPRLRLYWSLVLTKSGPLGLRASLRASAILSFPLTAIPMIHFVKTTGTML